MPDGQVPIFPATYVWSVRPDDVLIADARERLRVRSGVAEVVLSGDSPVPAGKTPTAGVLVLTATEVWPGSRTVTVQRVDPGRKILRLLTWNNRPSVDAAAMPVSVTQAGTVLQWRFDISADLAFAAAGGNLRGWRVTTTEAAGRFFHGPQARRTGQRPRVEASWVAKPPAPTGLVPSFGAVGVSKPVLGWAATVPFTAFHVQVDVNDGTFAAPLWQSNEVTSAVPTLALAQTTFAGLANLDDRDWRVRIKNAAGWSAWSLPGRLARVTKPVVVLTNPGATSGDGTPPFTWTVTGGPQTAYLALLLDAAEVFLWKSGLVPGAALTATPTKGLRRDGATGTAEVRVYDGVDREATPGDRAYAFATRTFTLDLTGGVTPGITGFSATVVGGSAAVDLTWGRSEPPDFWHVLRDGVTVAVLAGTDAYAFRDWTAQPFVRHEYRVLADVNGVKSSGVPVSVTTRPRQVWLADPVTGLAAPILTDEDGSWPRGITEEVHATVGGEFAVRVVSSLRAYEGVSFAGVVAGVPGLVDGATAIAFLEDLADAPSRVVRLIVGDVNIPVVTGITLAPDSRTREGDRVKGIQLTAWQQEEPGPVST